MAKSKSFFGLRRGSTKSMTFQVLNGAQITKDRVVDVKNPRTRTQMVQRMIMATAGSAYKHMREIVDHSFEGVSYGQRSYSEFMRLNVHDMVEDVRGDLGQFSYNPYGDTGLYPSPFIIARGSLNNPNKVVNFVNDNERWQAQIISQRVDTSEMTVNQMLNEFGLSIGDLLTIVGITKFTNEASWHFFWARLKVKAGGSTIVDQTNFNDVFEAQASEEPYGYAFTSNGFEVDFDWSNVEDDQIFGTTILSQRSNNRWLRSNAQIIFPGSPVNSPTAAEALATYPIGTDYILNGANIGGGILPEPNPYIGADPSLPVNAEQRVTFNFDRNVTMAEFVEHFELELNNKGWVHATINGNTVDYSSGAVQFSGNYFPSNSVQSQVNHSGILNARWV